MHIVRLVYSSSCFLPSVHVLPKYLAKRLWIWRYVCGVCFFSTTSPIVNLAPCRMGFRNKVACTHTGAKVKVESLRGSQLGVPCISWRLLTYIILFIPGQLGKPKQVGVHPTSDVGVSFPSSRAKRVSWDCASCSLLHAILRMHVILHPCASGHGVFNFYGTKLQGMGISYPMGPWPRCGDRTTQLPISARTLSHCTFGALDCA